MQLGTHDSHFKNRQWLAVSGEVVHPVHTQGQRIIIESKQRGGSKSAYLGLFG